MRFPLSIVYFKILFNHLQKEKLMSNEGIPARKTGSGHTV